MCVCVYILTACFHGDALKFAKKASLQINKKRRENMENKTFEGEMYASNPRHHCPTTQLYITTHYTHTDTRHAHSTFPFFQFYRISLVCIVNEHKIRNLSFTYLEICGGSRLECQWQWFLWHYCKLMMLSSLLLLSSSSLSSLSASYLLLCDDDGGLLLFMFVAIILYYDCTKNQIFWHRQINFGIR